VTGGEISQNHNPILSAAPKAMMRMVALLVMDEDSSQKLIVVCKGAKARGSNLQLEHLPARLYTIEEMAWSAIFACRLSTCLSEL